MSQRKCKTTRGKSVDEEKTELRRFVREECHTHQSGRTKGFDSAREYDVIASPAPETSVFGI